MKSLLIAAFCGTGFVSVAEAGDAGALVLRFDDNKAVSEWREVAEIFETAGGRCSFAVNSSWLSEEQWACLRELSERGHEIMDHTGQHALFQLLLENAEAAAKYGKADFFDHAEGPLVLCRPEVDLDHPKNVRAKARMTNGTLHSDDPAFLQNHWFGRRFYVPSVDGFFGIGKDCGRELFKPGPDQKCSDFWGRWTTNSFDLCEIVLLDDEIVQPSRDLLRAQARNTCARFAAHGIPAPRTWIRPGGWELLVDWHRMKEVLGDEFGYVVADNTGGAGLDAHSAWNYQSDFGFFDAGTSVDAVYEKAVASIRQGRSFAYISHQWTKDRARYLEQCRELAAKLNANGIRMTTYSHIADPAPVTVVSPDGKNAIALSPTCRGVEMSVSRHGKTQATAVFVGQGYRDADDAPDGRRAVIAHVSRHARSGKAASPVYKKAQVDLAANEAAVLFKGGWGFVIYARNDGVAYRQFTKKEGSRFLWREDTMIEYPSPDTRCWAGENNGFWEGDYFQNSWETVYRPTTVSQVAPMVERLHYLPFVTEHDGVFTAFTESDLRNHPGVDLVRWPEEDRSVRFYFARKPSETRVEGAHVRVVNRQNGFAQMEGATRYPWRVFVLSDGPAGLAASDIVWALARPADPEADFSWVKPGLATWNWWSTSGMDTDTLIRHADFAADFGIPYLLVDAGWNLGGSARDTKPNPEVDLRRVIAHAKKKGVRVVLWIGTAQTLGNEEAEMAYIASLGAAGVKIDFLDRDDQDAVAYMERVSAAAARHHLVIDWHGMFKPTGLERTYPNILNYEGVFGLETMRWDPFDDMPRNDCQAAFTRMVAGPMDYTPGGMRNVTRANYSPIRERNTTKAQGTRAHQVALFTLFFAPFQSMADSVEAYRADPECARYMAAIPTVWDDTVALPSEMGQTAALARRAGEQWHLAVIGDWSARTVTLPTAFLGEGTWTADILEDAPDSDREPTHWQRRSLAVKAGEPMTVRLAPGGGFSARFRRD